MIASPSHSHSPEWTVRPLRPFEPQRLFLRSNPIREFHIRLLAGAFGSWGIPIECSIYDYCDRYANLPSSSISSLINSEISRLRGFRLAAKRICGGGARIHHSHRSPRLFFSGGLPKTWGLLCCTNLSCQGWPWGKLRHTLRNVLGYPASTAPPWFFWFSTYLPDMQNYSFVPPSGPPREGHKSKMPHLPIVKWWKTLDADEPATDYVFVDEHNRHKRLKGM